jgi:MFS family permease
MTKPLEPKKKIGSECRSLQQIMSSEEFKSGPSKASEKTEILATSQIDWLLLSNAIVAQFLGGLSVRIFMVSLPSIADDLGADILSVSWALISFQLAGLSLSIIFGRLGDIYGRLTIYGLGFLVFTVSSFLCGVSQTVLQLIVFRFIQGVGAAMTRATARALAMDAMPHGAEGKAQGIMTAVYHTGFFLGPPLGGFIVEYVHWRAVFFVIVPVALVGIALSYLKQSKNLGSPPSGTRPPIDYRGAVFLISLALMLTLLLDRRISEIIGAWHKGVLAVIFVATAWRFLAHEAKAPSPIIALSLFGIRMFKYSIVSLVANSVVQGTVSFLLPFYLQNILDMRPTVMGAIFLVPPVFALTLAALAGHLTDRIGPRVPASIGITTLIGALLLGANLAVDSHWILPVAMLAFSGIGTAFFNSANEAAIIGSVPKENRGFAGGMVRTGFDLGHMLGVSLSGLIMLVAFRHHAGAPDAVPDPGNPIAFVSAINTSYSVAVILSLIALLASFMSGKGRISHPPPGS